MLATSVVERMDGVPCLCCNTQRFAVVQGLIFMLVTTVVERMDELVKPHAATIVGWLPAVWHASAGQGLLRMQVRCPSRSFRACLGSGTPLQRHL